MQSMNKGLHEINRRMIKLAFGVDLLSRALQVITISVCILSVILWPIFGFDSTLQMVFASITGKPITQEMAAGTHISTILNYALIIFLISFYLSKKEIVGFHNIIISVFVPIFAMFVFEWPWVIFTDMFHNSAVEGYWAISAYGLGTIDVGMLILGLALIPTSIFYIGVLWADKHLERRLVMSFGILAGGFAATILVVVSLVFGTPTVLIRNTFALFFVVFAHAVMMDATQNPNVPEVRNKYAMSPRRDYVFVLAMASTTIFVIWIIWPYFTQIKGAFWPQTIYAFYKNGIVDSVVFIQNDAVHAFNVLSKALVTAVATLLVIPIIKVNKK